MKTFLSFSKIFLGIIWVLSFGCGCTYQVEDGQTQDDDMRNLIGANLANMVRSTAQGSAVGGLAAGSIVPSVQQTNLEPGEYTIQFQVLPPPDNLGFAAYAIVDWKIAGQQIRRKVSIASGTSISGVAEAVSVSIVDVSETGQAGFPPTLAPLASGNPDPRSLYQIAASLSRGSRPTTMQPATLATQLSGIVVGPGAGQNFTVPADSGVTSAMVLTSVLAPDVLSAIIAQQQSAGATVLSNFLPLVQSPGWVPLLPGCTLIRVLNGSAVGTTVNVLWGIDG